MLCKYYKLEQSHYGTFAMFKEEESSNVTDSMSEKNLSRLDSLGIGYFKAVGCLVTRM